MLIDDEVAAVSPASVYRVLKAEGLLNRFARIRRHKGHTCINGGPWGGCL